jgi:hypothetical protein
MTTPARTATTIPSPDAALLRWRTHDSSRHLMQGFIGAFAIAGITGLLLWLNLGHGNFIQLVLLTHLAAGTLSFFMFVPFIVIHWRDGREPLRNLLWPFRLIPELQWDSYARKRLIGHGLMWLLMIVLLSGLIVSLPAIAYLAGRPMTLPYGAHVELLRAHAWMTIPLFAGLIWHLPKKDRK